MRTCVLRYFIYLLVQVRPYLARKVCRIARGLRQFLDEPRNSSEVLMQVSIELRII